MPARGYPAAEEFEVRVFYDLQRQDPGGVVVPSSGKGLTVLLLETEPRTVRESFRGGQRRLHVRDEHLQLRCRYRILQRKDADGRLASPLQPEDLFPGARSILLLHHRVIEPSAPHW